MRKSFLALMALGILPVSSAALVSTSAPAFANEVFTDNTFNLADYTSSPVFTSAGTSLTYNQCASCGNPGEGLQLIATFPPGTGSSAAVGLANNTFSYDPLTQGAISSVNASVDKNFTDNYPFLGTGSNTFHPLIEQGGNFYIASISGPTVTTPGTTGYNTISASGLVASDFEEYDFTTASFVAAFPNFDGGPMLFGLGQIFGSGTTNVSYTSEADYDNLQLTLDTPSPTPVPAALPLFASGLGGLGLLGLRTKRKAKAVAA